MTLGSCDVSLQWSTGGSGVGRREPTCWTDVLVAASPSESDDWAEVGRDRGLWVRE